MIVRLAVMAAAAAALSACVNVLPESGPPPDIYRLSAPGVVAGQEEPVPWIVELPPFLAPAAFDTDRIALSTDGVRISYVADARWSASAPRLLQSLIIDCFNAGDHVRAAVRPEDAVGSNLELRLELKSFEAVYRDGEGQPPTAELRLNAKIVDARSRALIATQRFAASDVADARDLDAIVAALDSVAHKTAEAVIEWTLQNSPHQG